MNGYLGLLLTIAVCVTGEDEGPAKMISLVVLPEHPKSAPQGNQLPMYYSNYQSPSLCTDMKDLLYKPMVMVIAAENSDDEMVAYLCHNGLSAIGDEVATPLYRFVIDNSDTVAVLIEPTRFEDLARIMTKEFSINRFGITRGMKMEVLTNALEETMPWIIIQKKQYLAEKNTVTYLKEVAELSIEENGVEILKDNGKPLLCFQKAKGSCKSPQSSPMPYTYNPYQQVPYPYSPMQFIVQVDGKPAPSHQCQQPLA